MKIQPVNNRYITPTSQKTKLITTNFTGVKIAKSIQEEAKTTLGDLANLFLKNLQASKAKRKFDSIDEKEVLTRFQKLQNNDKNVAKIFLDSGRHLTEATCSMFKFNRVFNQKELKALQCMLNTKGGTPEKHIIPTIFASRYFMEEKPDEELDAIIDSTPKIKRIFKNFHKLKAPQIDEDSYITLALLLKNSETIKEEEIKRYVDANLGLADIHLQDWFSGEKQYRDDILTLLENNPSKDLENLLRDAYELDYYPIVPNKNLLDKLKLLNEEPILFMVRDILVETCLAENLQKHLGKFANLPLLTQNTIASKLLGNLIINFENFKLENNLENPEITPNDYVKLAKLLSDTPLLNRIAQTEKLYNIPKITNSLEEIMTKNLKLITDNYLEEDVSASSILKMLFCPKLEENLPLLKDLIIWGGKDILKELTLKCQNFNPEFVSSARIFLGEKENLCTLATLPNFNQKGIVENLFHIAKMEALAMKHPERFMNYDENNIKETTIKELQNISKFVISSGEEFADMAIFIPEEISTPFSDLFEMFTENLLILYTALTNTDAEYMNMIFSKRVTTANEDYYKIANWKYQSGEIISNLLRNARTLNQQQIPIKLSGREKDFIVQNFPRVTNETFSNKLIEILKQNQTPLKNGNFILDYEALVNDYNTTVIKELGIISNNTTIKQWDKKFLPMILNFIQNDNGELKLIFDILSNGEFKEYIHNPFTKHGKSNLKTKKEFENLNLNYQAWIEGIPSKKFKIEDKNYSIELLDKSEPNGLFMGNYTSCCTGIDRKYGDSTPTYLLNTTFNIVVIKDSNDKIAGMTRIFINNNNGTPELIIDNTEFDTKLLNVPKTKLEKPILKYISDFSKALSNRKMPIFISENVYNIYPGENNSIVIKSIKPIGEITKEFLYINCVHERTDTKKDHRVKLRRLDI